ncbi:MAG: hypothetical protein HGB33_03960 [Syntrophaceae bacterium]|nr:hypothetical protein [Syntrophaceae bacterium]
MADTNIELTFRGSLFLKPAALAVKVEEGKLAQISGGVAINERLFSILRDLQDDFGREADILKQLSGDIVLEKFGVAYSKDKSVQLGFIIKIGGNSCQFTLLKGLEKENGFIVGVDLCSDNKLTLPRNFLSGIIGDIAIGNLGVYYASKPFKEVTFFGSDDFQTEYQVLPKSFHLTDTQKPSLPVHFPQGIKFSAGIFIRGVNILEELEKWNEEITKSQEKELHAIKEPADVHKEAENALAKGTTHWIETNKSIGPLTIRRVGLSYEAQRIGIKLDAGLQLSVLNLTLLGLGLSYPINKFTTKPKEIWENLEFNLDGASIAFVKGPLRISGGLIRVSKDPLQLDGTLLIQTPLFTICALGSYANFHGTHSLFIFAALQRELGGPPFFFITGLAAGFGVNRALKLPTINEVHNFPLIKAATDPDYLGADLDLRKVSEKLDEYIYPLPGNYWAAAGIKFTSFGQIESFALLSVSFGKQLEIAIIGVSKIRIPQKNDASAIVFAELAFKVVIAPSSGLLSFEARLTENSYVLRRDFKLRGGFAFYSWFAGQHEGDFVISIGGYHPRFIAPAHYPKPDLVEFSCKIGNYIAISGHCYFAFCPSAIMAGGGLSIVYQLGSIRAWFIAQADFLIQWKPLYYDIAISVAIGVALRLNLGIIRINLSVELSASVALHGPPLGGKVRVSLYIVTIEIAFGEAKRTAPPLLWDDSDAEKSFVKAFLPSTPETTSDKDSQPPPRVMTIASLEGLLRERKAGAAAISLVAPQKLALSARTLVPVTAATFNGRELADIPQPTIGGETPTVSPQKLTLKKDEKAPKEKLVLVKPQLPEGQPAGFGVRPMNKNSLHSFLEVKLEPNDSTSPGAKDYLNQYLDIAIVTKSVPLALWGNTRLDTRSAPREQMIDNALVGFEIRTKAGPRPWETPALDLKVLAYDRIKTIFEWTPPDPAAHLFGYQDKTLAKTVNTDNVKAKRAGILGVLAKDRKIVKPEDIHLEDLVTKADFIFQEMPAMARVGQYPPRGYLEA